MTARARIKIEISRHEPGGPKHMILDFTTLEIVEVYDPKTRPGELEDLDLPTMGIRLDRLEPDPADPADLESCVGIENGEGILPVWIYFPGGKKPPESDEIHITLKSARAIRALENRIRCGDCGLYRGKLRKREGFVQSGE